MKRHAALFITALTGGLVCAAPALAGDNCLTPRLVQSWNNLGEHAIVVRAIGGHRYRLDLAGTCQGIKDIISMTLTAHGTCVEQGDFVNYRYHQLGPQQCMITAVAPYTEEAPAQPSP